MKNLKELPSDAVSIKATLKALEIRQEVENLIKTHTTEEEADPHLRTFLDSRNIKYSDQSVEVLLKMFLYRQNNN